MTACRFRKLSPFDSRSAANQNMIVRLPPASLKTQNKGVTVKGAWACAVRAVPPAKAMYVVGMLTMIAIAGSMITWGQGLKGPMGDQGPPGPKGPRGDAGPPGPASGIRIVRSNCDETTCRVQCGENEMLLTAYCGPKRNPAIIPTEANRSVPQPDAGEQSSCCGVRADGVSIASAAPKHRTFSLEEQA
jgi:hypothetical protein